MLAPLSRLPHTSVWRRVCASSAYEGAPEFSPAWEGERNGTRHQHRPIYPLLYMAHSVYFP